MVYAFFLIVDYFGGLGELLSIGGGDGNTGDVDAFGNKAAVGCGEVPVVGNDAVANGRGYGLNECAPDVVDVEGGGLDRGGEVVFGTDGGALGGRVG